jgi:hypothetical protein
MEDPRRQSASGFALVKLEHVLREERLALKRLDFSAIERAAHDKLAIKDELERCIARGDWPDPARLARTRAQLVENQILLVHARDTARGLMQHALGAPAAYGPAGAWRAGGVARVDTRG